MGWDETRNTAFRRPWCFCDQRGVMDDVWCGRANRILADVISKARNPRTPQLIRPAMVWYDFKGQKPLILVHKIKKQAFRLGETPFFLVWLTICPRFQLTSAGFFFLSPEKKRRYYLPRELTWTLLHERMSGKFQRTYSNVAWRMSGKFQRTYIAWHDVWVESSRELT